MHIFIKQLCLTHIWLCFVASKKIAAVGTFPHLSLKSKALERTEPRTALIDCNYCTNILIVENKYIPFILKRNDQTLPFVCLLPVALFLKKTVTY